MKEKIYVEINGIKLAIVTEDGANYVEAVADSVREQMNSMLAAQKNCTLIEAALFTAMSLQSKCVEDEKMIKNLETQIDLYQASVNRLRIENEDLRARLEERN